ncbi:hypothetical protein TRVA0_001S00496 [Trichomonascus vanleenenianus]|uniref:uncharacterized protein n=1 Tax=Trichomonascus vanleenenianus TaxID=2268995 RepID=UPI003ECA7386
MDESSVSSAMEDVQMGNYEPANGRRQLVDSSFDLEAYISRYDGIIVPQRLIHIASTFAELRRPALEAAIAFLRHNTHNAKLYTRVARMLHGEDAVHPEDEEWVKRAQETTARRESGLLVELSRQSSSSGASKVLHDIFRLYLDAGDWVHAQRTLNKMMDTGTGSGEVSLAVVEASQYSMAMANTSFVRSQRFLSGVGEGPGVKTELGILKGMSSLELHDYGATLSAILNALDNPLDAEKKSLVASPQDVAMYITYCALVTLERQHMQFMAYKDPLFASITEETPKLRRLLHSFLKLDYATFFKCLDEMNDLVRLDMFLGPYCDDIRSLIVERAILQYLAVYNIISIDAMAESFPLGKAKLIGLVRDLIIENSLALRIDCQNGVIERHDVKPRDATFDKAVSVGNQFNSNAKVAIWSLKANLFGSDASKKKA